MTSLDLGVVAPVYRTAGTLEELVARTWDALGSVCSFELILVDDACPEGSGAAADSLAARLPEVRALHLPRNGGQHRAVLEGLRTSRGAWHAVLDADLQDPPEALPLLLERAGRGDVDVVFAGRRGRYEAPGRLLTSRAVKGLLAVLLGLPRDAGLYVVLSDAVRRRLLTLDGPEPSVVAMIGCTGARCTSVPVRRDVRAQGRSAYTGGARLAIGVRAVRWGLRHRLRSTVAPGEAGRA